MDGLIEHEVPQGNLPTMLVAFAGWPDAAEAATRAMRFLVRKLRAHCVESLLLLRPYQVKLLKLVEFSEHRHSNYRKHCVSCHQLRSVPNR